MDLTNGNFTKNLSEMEISQLYPADKKPPEFGGLQPSEFTESYILKSVPDSTKPRLV